jgi:thioesterase domain-containing protein
VSKDHPEDPEFAESMPAALYGNIAAELAREGNRPASVAVVDRIYVLLAAASTEQAKQDLLLYLGQAEVGIGELDAAIATAEQLPPGNHRDAIVLQVGFERAKAGDLSGALDDVTAFLYEQCRVCPLWRSSVTLLKRYIARWKLGPDSRLFRNARHRLLTISGVSYILKGHLEATENGRLLRM